MKIAIFSDSHDNLANMEKAVNWINNENIRVLIHCGDVCAPAVLKELSKNFSGQIHLVFGNVDGDHFLSTRLSYTELKNITVHGQLGEIELDNKKIAFTHLPWAARGLAATNKYDIVFYGHTHKPWEEMIGPRLTGGKNTKLVNPGTLGGMFNKPTFAVYDTETDKLELKILEKM